MSVMPFTGSNPIERKAEALAELEDLYLSHDEAVKRLAADERLIQRLQDRIELLTEELTNERDQRRICERKLIRLAANQRNISRIAQDGDEIMRSVQEWEDVAGQDGEPSAREIAERFAPDQPEDLNNVTSLETNKL